MAKRNWQPGAVIRKTLGEQTYYGRLLEFPWAAFYDYRTGEPSGDMDEITSRPVLFTLAAHKDLVAPGQWEVVGRRALEETLGPPAAQRMIDVLDPEHYQLIDDEGNIREATREEVEGLEPAAVWEPEHIADRLEDHYAGRPDRWLESMLSS
jgi:hypothetical protein